MKGSVLSMAKTATINIRTEPETKQKIEYLFLQFGITVSDAVNIFFNQSIMQNGIPFQLKIPEYNAETFAAIEDVDNNRNMSPVFDNMDDLMRSLNA